MLIDIVLMEASVTVFSVLNITLFIFPITL